MGAGSLRASYRYGVFSHTIGVGFSPPKKNIIFIGFSQNPSLADFADYADLKILKQTTG